MFWCRIRLRHTCRRALHVGVFSSRAHFKLVVQSGFLSATGPGGGVHAAGHRGAAGAGQRGHRAGAHAAARCRLRAAGTLVVDTDCGNLECFGDDTLLPLCASLPDFLRPADTRHRSCCACCAARLRMTGHVTIAVPAPWCTATVSCCYFCARIMTPCKPKSVLPRQCTGKGAGDHRVDEAHQHPGGHACAGQSSKHPPPPILAPRVCQEHARDCHLCRLWLPFQMPVNVL